MRKVKLLPNYFMKIGMILVGIWILLFLVYCFTAYDNMPRILGSFVGYFISHAFFVAGMLMITFSREKNEDECVMQIRVNSFLRAVLCYCVVLMLSYLVWPYLKGMLQGRFSVDYLLSQEEVPVGDFPVEGMKYVTKRIEVIMMLFRTFFSVLTFYVVIFRVSLRRFNRSLRNAE